MRRKHDTSCQALLSPGQNHQMPKMPATRSHNEIGLTSSTLFPVRNRAHHGIRLLRRRAMR